MENPSTHATATKKTLSQAALAANQQNAQKSTGPRTAEGRAKSASNSLRHGLTASSEIYLNPEDQADYETLKTRLEKECLPASELEHQTFLRYAFATYQSQRAQRLEAAAQDRWVDDPDNHQLFLHMERLTKLTGLLERRADKALAELRKLQADRLATLHLHNEQYTLETKTDIPATYPSGEILKRHYATQGPSYLSTIAMNFRPEVKAILDKRTQPPRCNQ